MNKRPKLNDDAVIALVSNELSTDVADWVGSQENLKEIRHDLTRALKFSSLDGYDLAKRLDYYDPDTELVNILDDADSMMYSAYNITCRKWVSDNGLFGPEIGASISFAFDGKQIEGEVVNNYDYGQSSVFCESLGHVREGFGTHSVVVNWEDLTEVAK